MKIGIININEKLTNDLENEFYKIKFGVKFKFYGKFMPIITNFEQARRDISRAVIDALDDKVDYLVICITNKFGDFSFLENLGEIRFLYLYGDYDEIKTQLPNFVTELSDKIEHKFYNMYESESCGCKACRESI